MIEIFKNKYIFMLSSLVASGASYLLNFTLIFLLEDKTQYAEYLSLNSWAIYLSTFIYLSIIDLHISPEGENVDMSYLFGMSTFVMIAVSLFLCALYAIGGHEFVHFSVIFTAICYALVKLLTQYFLYCSQIGGVVGLRYGRSLLIGIVIISLYLVKEYYQIVINATNQVLIQGFICAIVSFVLIFIFKINIEFKKDEFIEIYEVFKSRIVKRNISMVFDMVHIPLMYHIISENSEYLSSSFIYALGLILPMAYVISVILKEQMITKLGKNGYHLISMMSKFLLAFISISYSMIAVQYLFGDLYLVASLFFLGCLISFSGCVGLSIYKKGLEKLI